uniref:5'-nucleotidase n=1 Tax=Caligus clemensi TaxID=344056 RepID=C1C026_CALCM|nr:Cytosolic 5-nucleotidase III-like protein A [Caligus clemensi]
MMDYLNGYEHKKNLRVKDSAGLNKKLEKIKEDSFEHLQVISDFDYTLSKYHNGDGDRLDSSWGIIEKSSVFPSSFREKCRALFNKYHPYEVDPQLSIPEKTPHVAEWYTKLIELMTVYITDMELIKRSLSGCTDLQLRDGVPDFVSRLYEHHVPFLIFSAGFGELIKELMTTLGLFHSDYTKIHSNFLDFDESCKKVVGIKEPVVHVFNKNGASYLQHTSPTENEVIRGRKNILLFGDSLGDLTMSEGIPQNLDESTIIKIGFLNHDVEAYLDRYMNEYDVVIIDDQTMNFPLQVLKLISKDM